MKRPAPGPKCSSTTSVMSRPGWLDDKTNRDSARCDRYIVGPISRIITSGQKPPMPALIGRNRMPAPTAVLNRLSIQLVS